MQWLNFFEMNQQNIIILLGLLLFGICAVAVKKIFFRKNKHNRKKSDKLSSVRSGEQSPEVSLELYTFRREIVDLEKAIAARESLYGHTHQVKYHLDETNFMLPSGLMTSVFQAYLNLTEEKKEGRFSISSRKYSMGYIISISDRGISAGSFPSTTEVEEALREQLSTQSQNLQKTRGAELLVRSIAGQGTTTTIIVPEDYKIPEGNKQETMSTEGSFSPVQAEGSLIYI